jgi:rfaE bifunctional protein kinase chain/domain
VAKDSSRIVERFVGQKLVVVGDIIIDQYVGGTVKRISPEAPIPILRESSREKRLGGAAYVAGLLCSLGAEVQLIGIVGTDTEGGEVLRLAEEQGIGVSRVVRAPGRPTTLKTRLVASRQQMLRVDREDDSAVGRSLAEAVEGAARESMAEGSALVLSDYDKGLFRGGKWTGLIKNWRGAGKPVLADAKPGNIGLLRGVSVATPNQSEAASAAGIVIEDEASLNKAGLKLLKTLSAEGLLITRGPQGMALFRPGRKVTHIPTKAREVFDVTGAGDAVIATMALCLTCGAALETAARIANSAGGVVVGKLGVAKLTAAELRRAVRQETPR